MATIQSAAPAPVAVRPKQNWVVSPAADAVFIIGAPVVAFLLFAPIYAAYGISAVLFIFFGFNLGHHVPTFIRVYGDRALLERFRWNLLLAPVIPFTFAMCGIAYLILAGYSVPTIMFLYLILNIWDPWHFMMQNHGFMRIYDRHNLAPRKLAGRMDLALGWSWFLYIMIGAVNWLPDLLYSGRQLVGVSLMPLFRSGVFGILETAAFAVAVAVSVVYAGYLVWCAVRGYYVSYAKLLFFAVTYGMMYLTYVPNSLMSRMLPAWTFTAGFATLGMVHVSQYLAIVWKYNRALAQRHEAVRDGIFVRMFGRGGTWVLLLYVAACLAYGFGLRGLMALNMVQSTHVVQQILLWIAGTGLAINFTSTITHYYYDGFIWKIRHKENRRNLAMQEGDEVEEAATQTVSWWEARRVTPAMRTFLRQSLYFGVPMLLVTIGAGMVRHRDELNPDSGILHIRAAQDYKRRGLIDRAVAEYKLATAAFDRRIELERQMLEIRATPAHYVMLGQAIDFQSRLTLWSYEIAPSELNVAPAQLHLERIAQAHEAIACYEKALELPPSLGLPTDLNLNTLSRNDVADLVSSLDNEIVAKE